MFNLKYLQKAESRRRPLRLGLPLWNLHDNIVERGNMRNENVHAEMGQKDERMET